MKPNDGEEVLNTFLKCRAAEKAFLRYRVSDYSIRVYYTSSRIVLEPERVETSNEAYFRKWFSQLALLVMDVGFIERHFIMSDITFNPVNAELSIPYNQVIFSEITASGTILHIPLKKGTYIAIDFGGRVEDALVGILLLKRNQ